MVPLKNNDCLQSSNTSSSSHTSILRGTKLHLKTQSGILFKMIFLA